MSNIFNVDNKFFSIINKFVDLLFLSVLIDVICGPALFFGLIAFKSIETFDVLSMILFVLCTALIGPGLTALYYSVVKCVRKERSYAVKEFFKAYKNNFKQGSIISLLFGLIGSILFLDLYITNHTQSEAAGGSMNFIVSSVLKAMILLLTMLFVYVFPVLSRFTMKLKTLILSSFMMSIRHLGKTVLLILIDGVTILGPVVLAYLFGADSLDFYFQFCLIYYLILPGLGCLLASLVLEKVFKVYMKPTEGSEEETGEDRWYLE